MRLAVEVHAEIQAVISGRIAARELEGWLDSVAPEVRAEGDGAPRALTDRVFSLLAELNYGDRTADDVRRELAGLVPATTRDAGSVPPRAETSSASGTADWRMHVSLTVHKDHRAHRRSCRAESHCG
jgi:hypothetical protein